MNDRTHKDEFSGPLPANDAETPAQPLPADTMFFGESPETPLPPRADPEPRPAPVKQQPARRPSKKKSAQQWERPAPVSHDHHYKAWLIFISLIFLSIAFLRPVRLLIQRTVYRTPVSTSTRNATEFIALAYDGVEDKPSPGSASVSTAMFREQMRMLADAGYNPVTLKDVRAFYQEGVLLPPKAVLITFEQAKRGTYNQVKDILKSAKWPAVMGVATMGVRSMNPDILIWHYLRNMHDLGFWELAAESHRGFTEIETAPNDAQATFFTSPMWLPAEKRYELPVEFERRIEADHQFVIDEFQRELRDKPIAFFFPLGNYGQYDDKAKLVRTINLSQVEKHYDLGFTVGMLALNTRDSDPRRLNRLLVDPSWSPNAFLSMVESFWPKPWPDEPGASIIYDSSSWLADWGEVYARGKTLIMHAAPTLDDILDLQSGIPTGTTGAKAWLVGTDTFRDGHVSMLFNMRRGRFGIYLRATKQGEYIFIGIDERGNVSARQKLQDVDELILATDTMDTDTSVSHNLSVHLRDNLLFVQLDGSVLFGGRILLRGSTTPGLIGASIWDPITGVAATEIISTRISGRRDAAVTWSPETARNTPHLNRWLSENAFRFAALSPPWIEIVSAGSTVTLPWDAAALSLIARANDARIMPTVKIHEIDALARITETSISARAHEQGANGVFVDAQSCREEQVPALLAWLSRLNDSLRNNGMRLMLRLPDGFSRFSSSINVVSILQEVTLIGNNLEPYGLPASRTMPIVSVPPSDFNQTISYYYQVTDMLGSHDDISTEARNEEHRQNGFEAFAAGAYDEAIAEWRQWSERDPENAEPLALIGDALLRKEAKPQAAESYAASLDKNPGQINLAVRYAQLLLDIGRLDEATRLMDVYARTFPDNAEVAIAQARWLERTRRRGDARTLMRNLVEAQPKNIDARLVLQNYLDDPPERYENMHTLRTLVESSETYHYGFAQELVTSELLTIPEATIFFPFIRKIAKDGPSLRTRKIYEELLPLTQPVSENFTINPLSDAWIPWDGMHTATSGKYQLRASPSASEAFIRLKKSELMRDGAMAVTIDESVGAFWIYARRSNRSMLRFGYDNDGFIRLQTWFDGQLKSTEWQPWLRPPGVVTLSLEVRGDGAMGFEDGRPLFNTRIRIPNEISYGWWSIAPYSPNLGSAKASILRIDVEPLPAGLAIIPLLPPTAIPDALEVLRRNVRDISIVAPVVMRQHPNGSLPLHPDFDTGPYKMFCAFHRIRLVPVIEAPFFSNIKPSLLVETITRNRFQGIVLRVTSMPPDSWFEEMTREMEKTSAGLIVIQSTEPLWPNRPESGQRGAEAEWLRLKSLPPATLREVELGNLILPPIQQTWTVPLSPAQEWAALPSETRRKGITPRLIVLPVTEWIEPDAFEKIRKTAPATPPEIPLPPLLRTPAPAVETTVAPLGATEKPGPTRAAVTPPPATPGTDAKPATPEPEAAEAARPLWQILESQSR